MGLKLARHTPTVVGAAWSPFQFWDGRKDSLWSQALAPFEGAAEMGTNRMRVVRRVLEVYGEPYRELFGELPALDPSRFPPDAMPMPDDPEHPWARAWSRMGASERATVDALFARVGKAIAAYERRLLPPEADFDRYARALASGDPSGGGHLSAAARRGLRAFIGRAGCIHCHNGPLFTDFAFHNVGLAPTPGETRPDLGRAAGVAQLLNDPFNSAGPHSDSPALDDLAYLNPEFEDFRGAFKTPGLRNVAASAPYGHNGQFAELAEVLEWYAELPLVPLGGHRDLLLRVLPRDVDQADLVAFLEAL